MASPVRTRFAPSPTGYLHVGGIRTALFAFLVARQTGGSFILRFEDTDKKREVEGSAEHLIKSLRAIDIDYDEGPDVGGPYAPYIQSERLASYRKWAEKLIASGRAYAHPYTAQEVQQYREQAQKEKRAFLYRNHRPHNPPAWDGTTPLRFKSDPSSYAHWKDAPVIDQVMGELAIDPNTVDDFILIKSDGYPTYNFAHIIDDAEMHITHVIRGQEFLSSMPNFLALYDALDLERPVFAHLPHILNEQGNKKLGKRDGAKDVLDYIRGGYLPETMMSFIATMGWNDGTEQEIYTKDELIEKFSLERVQRSGARFDEKRLLWMNGQWIRRLTLDDLYGRVEGFWSEEASEADEIYKKQVLSLVQDRLQTLTDLPALTSYFFNDPSPDWTMRAATKPLKDLESSDIRSLLQSTHAALHDSEFDPEPLQATLNSLLVSTAQKPAVLFSLIRLVVSWAAFSPALNDTLSVLGKAAALRRIETALQTLPE